MEARRVYRRDFDAQFPLSPSVHASSESSEAPSSEDSYEKHDRRKEKQARIGIQTWLRYRRDHPHAFSYRPRPTPTQPFNFMGLPVEMRCEILRLLLERNKELTDVSANATFPNATFPNATFEPYEMVPVDTRLFAVSRQMQEDAKIVFFSSNTIRMPITLCRLPLFIRKPPPSIRQLRKVHVSIIHNFEVLDQPRLAENLERVADLLKECKKLVQLKILQSCLDSLRDTYSKHLFRESLEYFTRVQEVGEVILTEDEPPKDVGFSWIVPPEDMITRLKTVMQSPKTE